MKEKFSFSQFIVPQFWKKFFLMFFSILFMGFFLSFLIEVGWGTDPITFMNLNLSHIIGWTFGNWQLALNALMLLLVIYFKVSFVGFGTIFNMTLIGYVADFCLWLWSKNGLHNFIANGAFCTKLAFFLGAIICFVVVAAIYMNSQMGLSPYDACAKLFSTLFSKLPFFAARIIFDLSAIFVGFLASFFSPDGIQSSCAGAIVIGLLLGPAITLVGKKLKF